MEGDIKMNISLSLYSSSDQWSGAFASCVKWIVIPHSKELKVTNSCFSCFCLIPFSREKLNEGKTI